MVRKLERSDLSGINRLDNERSVVTKRFRGFEKLVPPILIFVFHVAFVGVVFCVIDPP